MANPNLSDDVLQSKFTGSMLGTMVGDALGAPLEGWECETLNRMLDGLTFLTHAERELSYAMYGVITGGEMPPSSARYTDDTQMMIGVAESLIAVGGFDGPDLAQRFAENFEDHRGYGFGARIVLTKLRNGAPWNEPGERLFGGLGSFGNGAAMRVAPIGLFYHGVEQVDALRRVAEASARVTHTHVMGTEGAIFQAAAVAAATRASVEDDFDPYSVLDDVKRQLRPDSGEYLSSCNAIQSLLWDEPDTQEVADILGNGVEAHLSVPAALYSFLAHYDSFSQAVLFAIRLGGDTDTIGAMCGAIAGAFHGADAIPANWLAAIENGHRGRDYVRDLSVRLFGAWGKSR